MHVRTHTHTLGKNGHPQPLLVSNLFLEHNEEKSSFGRPAPKRASELNFLLFKGKLAVGFKAVGLNAKWEVGMGRAGGGGGGNFNNGSQFDE